MADVIVNGKTVDFKAAVKAMNNKLRVQVFGDNLVPDGDDVSVATQQRFVDIYAKQHEAQIGKIFTAV